MTTGRRAAVWLQAPKSPASFIFCAISDLLYDIFIFCLSMDEWPEQGLGVDWRLSRGAGGIVWSVFYENRRKIILNVSQDAVL